MARRLILLCISVLITVALADRRPKEYTIDMDKDPKVRWSEVVEDYKDYAHYIRGTVKALYKSSSELAEYRHMFTNESSVLWSRLSEDQKLEIKGIAELSGVPADEMLLMNTFYDFTAWDWLAYLLDTAGEDGDLAKDFQRLHGIGPSITVTKDEAQRRQRSKLRMGCTAILVKTDEGRTLHARNFDYRIQDLPLENLVISVKFIKNGKPLYDAVMIALSTFVQTGQRPGVYTLSLNQREHGRLEENLYMAFVAEKANIVGMLIRNVLETEDTYDGAYERIHKEPLIAPCYLALTGLETAVIITRSRRRAVDVWRITGTPDKGWYVLATNYDRWKDVPSYDQRRVKAHSLLGDLGQDETDEQLLHRIINTKGVIAETTIFNTIMAPDDPTVFHKYLWLKTDPIVIYESLDLDVDIDSGIEVTK